MTDPERQVSVTVAFDAEVDPSRIDEYVRENFEDGDQVQIQDIQTGEIHFDNIGCSTLFPNRERDSE